MTLFFRTLLALLCMVGSAMAASAPFFSAMPDVPLMAGLRELPDQTLMFDKPGGRIVESFAELRAVHEAQVLRYYENVLPQFGWSPSPNGGFIRKGETLRLEFEPMPGGARLHIMIAPL